MERVTRCAKGGTNALCWGAAAAKRFQFIVSGCDFVVEAPDWGGHVTQLGEKLQAAAKCTAQAANNCTNILGP